MGIYFEEEPLLKPFEELTGKEAKAYFEWFLSYIPPLTVVFKRVLGIVSRLCPSGCGL